MAMAPVAHPPTAAAGDEGFGDLARLSFRLITPGDLLMLHGWLGRPHVAEWWSDTPSVAELQQDYVDDPANGGSTRGYIALRDGEPIGFIQSYVVMGSGDGWWEDETDPGARGIDQFLANAEQLGQGLGTAMVRAFVMLLFADPAVTQVQTDPSPRNERAIRCYRRAGFSDVGGVSTPDGPAWLMRTHRPHSATAGLPQGG
jgi:RimJ/RimL family protein N-acetyltransferase